MRTDNKFTYYKKYFFLQCTAVTLTIGLIIYILTMQNAVIVASIGASAFIIFASPHGYYARPKKLIGGHLVGLLFGTIFSLINIHILPTEVITTAFAVGCTFFLMVLIDVEHPPAAGTALGIVFIDVSLPLAIAIVASVCFISLIHHLLRPYMKDLI